MRRLPALVTLLVACSSQGSTDAPGADSGVADTAVDAPVDDRWFQDHSEALAAVVRPIAAWSSFSARMQGGVCALDVDLDGRIDLVFPGVAGGTRLMHAEAPFQFTERPLAEGFDALGCLAFDPDGDGDLDLLLTGAGARFFENQKGTLVDASARLPTLDPTRLLTAAVAFDADGDGDLDLAVADYGAFVDPGKPCPGGCANAPSNYKNGLAHLWLRRPDGGFDDASDRLPFTVTAPALVLVATDLDEDGRVDLFVGNDTSASLDRYFRRKDDGAFEEIAEALGVAYTPKPTGLSSMSATSPDFDGDGHLDLVESTWEQEPSAVFLCNGTAGPKACRDASEDLELFRGMSNLRFGQAPVDLDHDGVLELVEAVGHVYLTSDPMLPIVPGPAQAPLLLWRRDRANAPLQLLPTLPRATGGRGLLAIDLDGDGDLDLVTATATGSPLLYENVRTKRGQSLVVRLDGKAPNRFGVGARVTVKTSTLTRAAMVHAGHGYLSSDPGVLHFGVGDATTVSVDVRWPSGKTSHVDAKPSAIVISEP